MHAFLVGCVAACGPALGADAAPQGYPSRNIRLIVPYPPGAANDILARALGQRLAVLLGQNIVVDNRAGAGGHIGTELAARSPADGHTLVLGTTGIITMSPGVYARLPYDAVRDLAPVTLFATVPYVFAASPSLPAKSIKELVALARARPGRILFASSGNASAPHLCGEMLKVMAGIDMVHVPYKGGAQAVTDVVAGQTQFYCGGVPTVLAQLRAGRMHSLGLATAARSQLLPDEPTVAEQGYAGFDVSSWTGILVPAATPAAVVARLHGEIARVMASQEMKNYVLSQGAEPAAVPPDAFAGLIRRETARWAEVARAARVKVD